MTCLKSVFPHETKEQGPTAGPFWVRRNRQRHISAIIRSDEDRVVLLLVVGATRNEEEALGIVEMLNGSVAV